MSTKVAPHVTAPTHQYFWLWVMCLTGVDYFSTLGYQPSIAFENAGMLAPLATVVLVLVTLLGAYPIYSFVASQSSNGQGSIGMFARLMSGWPAKLTILVLLGFAATDFVITKTLSAADAAEHLIHNPYWPIETDTPDKEADERLVVTMFLLILLGTTFLRGFQEVIGLAVLIVAVFMTINGIVILSGLAHLVEHPDKIGLWFERLETGQWYLSEYPLTGDDWGTILILSLLFFPKLALGLSGFETGVAVMPLIRGKADDAPDRPKGRIRNTRKLLFTAAIVMCCFLLGSSLVVSTLIPPEALIEMEDVQLKPAAKDRALAYLAHGQGPETISPLFGGVFGTIYDLSTVVILWFAGASAMAALLNLVPQYLPRYGMAPEWARAVRPLVLLLTGINLVVTLVFNADVSAQGGAYATGVLVLLTSAGVASVIQVWKLRAGAWYRRLHWGFCLVTLVFVYTTADIIITKPDGIKIAGCFIVAIVLTSLISRVLRSRELRFTGFHIPDVESKLFWDTIKHLELSILVPHRPGRHSLVEKEIVIRREHRIPRDMIMIFVQVKTLDPSEFYHEPRLEITQQEGRYVMKVTHAASVSHTLAAVALEMAKVGLPPEIHFGWTEESPWSGTLGFLLFGEGNVPWMVRELIRRAEPVPERRPLIVIAGN